MAQTLVGRLQLVVQALGLGEGEKVANTLKGIESAAKKLDGANWGANFQRQMDKLAIGAKELAAVRQSFNSLEKDMRTRGLSQALQKSEISRWQTATLGHFAGLRNEMQSTEKRAQEHIRSLQRILRPIGYAAGVGGIGYGAGMALRNAAIAAAEQTRTKYRLDLANVPPAETSKMSAEASRLSTKYPSIDETSILELNKTALALFGGNGDRARAMMEPVIKAFVADMTQVGVDKAGENLSSFLKAMDNLNVNEGPDGGIENMQGILDGWMKAKQVEGKDLDVGDILGFAQRAKIAKYALSDEFLANVLPALGQDMGFDSLGDALSGAYQNFVTPSSGGTQGQYVKRQKAMGLRDKNNSLVERDRFASDPYDWTLNVLKPMLAKNGVDTGNTAAVSEAIKKLMSNSKAAGALTGWIVAQQQIDKNVALYKGATGLGDAENARQKDPMIAQEAFYASLRNLSAAVVPMTTIAAGLNAFADSINAFKDRVRAQDPMVLGTAGVVAAGAAAWGTYKVAAGIWGLITAGAALNSSAAALTAAAAKLAGGSAIGDIATGASSGKGKAGLGVLGAAGVAGFAAGGVAAIAALIAKSPEYLRAPRAVEPNTPLDYVNRIRANALPPAAGGDERRHDRSGEPGLASVLSDVAAALERKEHVVDTGEWRAPAYEPPRTRGGVSDVRPMPTGDIATTTGQATLDTSAATAEADRAGAQIQQALSVQGTPRVDTTELRTAVSLAQTLLSTLQAAGVAAARAKANTEAQMRRSFSDYGVSP